MFDLFLERREFFLKAAEGVFGEGHRNLGCCGGQRLSHTRQGLKALFSNNSPCPTPPQAAEAREKTVSFNIQGQKRDAAPVRGLRLHVLNHAAAYHACSRTLQL